MAVIPAVVASAVAAVLAGPSAVAVVAVLGAGTGRVPTPGLPEGRELSPPGVRT